MRLKAMQAAVFLAAFLFPGQLSAQIAPPVIEAGKSTLEDGGQVRVSGQVPPGSQVFIEVWSEYRVRASFFDSRKDDATGAVPYRLYLSEDIPAYYRIYVPASKTETLKAIAAEGNGWSYAKALAATGADIAYKAPAATSIDAYQSSLLASIAGSRGEKLPALAPAETRRRSMQLVKARFRKPAALLVPEVRIAADGSYSAMIDIPKGSAPGTYRFAAVTSAGRSEPAVLENTIAFPTVYLRQAGTSINLMAPFLLSLAISIAGVLMGAGGGFILNPLLVSLWPLPHTVVAGTVMPTILFSQSSGIYSYSRIKFISWKLGVTLGLFMLAGGFIGPKLTEMITVDQFKFVFGWILLILAALMLWQTTPAYLRKNAKEQAILKEFKARAEASARSVPAPRPTPVPKPSNRPKTA